MLYKVIPMVTKIGLSDVKVECYTCQHYVDKVHYNQNTVTVIQISNSTAFDQKFLESEKIKSSTWIRTYDLQYDFVSTASTFCGTLFGNTLWH